MVCVFCGTEFRISSYGGGHCPGCGADYEYAEGNVPALSPEELVAIHEMRGRPVLPPRKPEPVPKPIVPHRDPLVLHAPGKCSVCDLYPRKQAARIAQKISFTGDRLPGFGPCPSTLVRTLEDVYAWPGNRPTP